MDFSLSLREGRGTKAKKRSNLHIIISAFETLLFLFLEILGSEEDDWKEIRVLDKLAIHPFTKEKIPIVVIEKKVVEQSDRSIPIVGIPSEDKNHQLIAEKAKIKLKNLTSQKLDQDEIINRLRSLKIGGYWTSANLKGKKILFPDFMAMPKIEKPFK